MMPIIRKLGSVWATMLIQILQNRLAGYAWPKIPERGSSA